MSRVVIDASHGTKSRPGSKRSLFRHAWTKTSRAASLAPSMRSVPSRMSFQNPVESVDPGNNADTPTTAMGGRFPCRDGGVEVLAVVSVGGGATVGELAADMHNVAARLREYLERGGFLMIDDFHGALEWRGFEATMRRVFPERELVDIEADAEPFHVLYDLSEREQIPGIRALMSGRTWEKGGRHPVWRAVLDDAGRVMVLVNHNQDLGDAWEHADDARYPEALTAQAYRLGVNYVVYAMTH